MQLNAPELQGLSVYLSPRAPGVWIHEIEGCRLSPATSSDLTVQPRRQPRFLRQMCQSIPQVQHILSDSGAESEGFGRTSTRSAGSRTALPAAGLRSSKEWTEILDVALATEGGRLEFKRLQACGTSHVPFGGEAKTFKNPAAGCILPSRGWRADGHLTLGGWGMGVSDNRCSLFGGVPFQGILFHFGG